MSGSKDILIANLRAEIAAGRVGEESNAEERRVVGQLLDELLPKRIAEAESYGYDNGYRDGLRTATTYASGQRAALRGVYCALLFAVGVCDEMIADAKARVHVRRAHSYAGHRHELSYLSTLVESALKELAGGAP